MAVGFQREGVRRGAGPARGGGREDLVVWTRLATDPPGPVPRVLPDLPDGVLTDGVVTLRPRHYTDIDFLHTLLNHTDIVSVSVPPIAPDHREVELRCTRSEGRWLAGERADLVVLDAATGIPTGEIGLYVEDPDSGELMIGYAMSPSWRGRGYPTRAARLVAAWAFTVVGADRLIARTFPGNRGSQRVLEKVGFRHEGLLRGSFPGVSGTRADEFLYALTAEDIAKDLVTLTPRWRAR
jgi:RimJ/RimL family protein N-acetyltransferase